LFSLALIYQKGCALSLNFPLLQVDAMFKSSWNLSELNVGDDFAVGGQGLWKELLMRRFEVVVHLPHVWAREHFVEIND
jgi:hypothetical protein